jgi:hypothetical protein
MSISPLAAAALAAAVTLGALGTGSVAQEKRQRVFRCVRYNQSMGADKQSVDVGLANRCGHPVTCSIEWKVSCEEGDGTEGGSGGHELAKGEKVTVNASAASCGDGDWEIHDVRWSCERL